MHSGGLKIQINLFLFSLLLLLIPLFFSLSTPALGVSHSVVISEIKVAGFNANDEFVELFNASDLPVDLKSWRLTRKLTSASAGASPDNLVASLSGTIAPHSFFLITHPASASSPSADRLYSSSGNPITPNNTLSLFSDAGLTLVDEVKMGAATDFDLNTVLTPASNTSIERKACELSSPGSMAINGSDQFAGNGIDSDNNAADFVLRSLPQPQNSFSQAEVEACPTPSPSVTPTPLPSPTSTPVPTATPSPSPTVAPTPTSTPVPTVEPTATPTPLPTATPTPSPTVLPSPTPTATSAPPTLPQRPDDYTVKVGKYTCEVTYRLKRVKKIKVWVPEVECRKTRDWHWWKWERHHDHDRD